MQLGLRLPLGPDLKTLAAIAQEAERMGCDSVWVSDHLVWPTEIQSNYPYAEHGGLPVPPDTPFYDPLLTLAVIATSTTRLRLATGVFVLPLRETLAVARAVATLDSLSDGRVIFGVGIGWMKEEFIAAGADFERRAELTDEMIESLRVLWGAEPHGYDGRFVRFLPVHLEPTPPQEGNIPIHVGGETPAALERASRLGNGWISMQQTVDSARRRIQQLETRRAAHARQSLPFESSVLIPWPTTPELLDEYRRAGVTRALVYPWKSSDWRVDLEGIGTLIEQAELTR